MKIKVIYNFNNGGNAYKRINSLLDASIGKFMESIGAIWYAQGFDFEKGERDICFDLEVKE